MRKYDIIFLVEEGGRILENYEITYELFMESKNNEDIGEYNTYSIRDKSGSVCVSDITTNLKEALEILVVLNSNKVSTVHLKDVIEDLLE